MKRVLFSTLIILWICAGCTNSNDGAVNIRIKNVSSLIFDEVQVGNAQEVHADVASGSYSDYLQYKTAYNYAYVQIKSGAEAYVLQPVDFVGETPLSTGFYTYELNISEGGYIELKFVVD